jgi:hypothetical protein
MWRRFDLHISARAAALEGKNFSIEKPQMIVLQGKNNSRAFNGYTVRSS